MCFRFAALLLAVIPLSAADSVGAAACQKCHAAVHHQWTESRHSKMVQPATAQAVQGDFARGRIVLQGKPYVVERRATGFYISETLLTGKLTAHHVDYTLGNRRIQHYLTKLADGRIIVLPPSWDIRRKQWFHNSDIDDPEEVPGVQLQLWNKSCYSCHVSQEQKNFVPAADRYNTKWIDFGINCERCHGPGGQHIAKYSAGQVNPKAPDDIVMQSRLSAERNTMICAQCHSFRDIYVDGFKAGDNYYDHFLPILQPGLGFQEDAAYWDDGRTRRFSNDAFGLWQSECYLKGQATCISCHAIPHNTNIDKNPQLAADSSAICTQCHTGIGEAIEKHTHHTLKSAGSSCVDCHMPRTVLSIKAEIRDHSMTVPVPENTIHHQIPNACNMCHKDRTPEWAAAKITEWYGAPSRSRSKLIRRADAFAGGNRKDTAAIGDLAAILLDPAEGPLPRANAAAYLARYPGQAVAFDALYRALNDKDPLVRAMAALSVPNLPAYKSMLVAALTPMLDDPASVVRVTSAVSLVNLGVKQLTGDDEEKFERARQIYRQRAALNNDDATNQAAAGEFYLRSGNAAAAIDAFQAALKLDPEARVRYSLAQAYVAHGKLDDARKVLASISPGDSQYARAQRLLENIRIQIALQPK